MNVSTEMVLKLAELTRLEMSASEAVTYRNDLAAILAYFENLDEVDTSGIPPTARVFEGYAELREDVPRPSLTIEEIAAMADDSFDPAEGVFVLQGVFGSNTR